MECWSGRARLRTAETQSRVLPWTASGRPSSMMHHEDRDRSLLSQILGMAAGASLEGERVARRDGVDKPSAGLSTDNTPAGRRSCSHLRIGHSVFLVGTRGRRRLRSWHHLGVQEDDKVQRLQDTVSTAKRQRCLTRNTLEAAAWPAVENIEGRRDNDIFSWHVLPLSKCCD